MDREATAAPRRAPLGKLDNLQILRALAATTVVALHAMHETESLGPTVGRPPVTLPNSHLAFGVDIFFALSGFIMMHTAGQEFARAGAPTRFFLRRCARVIPLYWLLTTVMLIGAAFAPSLLNTPIGDLLHVAASYLFIPDARGAGEVRPVVALGWTLNYEMMFYAMFAIALTTSRRFGLMWLSALMATLALAHNVVDPGHYRVAFWTDPVILEFLFGVWVAWALRSGARLYVAGAALAFAVGLMGFAEAPFSEAPPFLREGVPAALIVAAGALGPTWPLGRLGAALVMLGDASYSLYLSHPFVLRPAHAIWAKTVGGHLPLAVFVILSTLVSALAAIGLYRGVEKPLTAFVQSRFFAGRPLANARVEAGRTSA